MEGESEIELRQIFDPEDMGEAFTPELQAKAKKLEEQMARSKT
jgi:hypothetical protein